MMVADRSPLKEILLETVLDMLSGVRKSVTYLVEYLEDQGVEHVEGPQRLECPENICIVEVGVIASHREVE
jgi:hypothetical protein